MKKIIVFLLILATFTLCSCTEKNGRVPDDEELIGNWIIDDENDNYPDSIVFYDSLVVYGCYSAGYTLNSGVLTINIYNWSCSFDYYFSGDMLVVQKHGYEKCYYERNDTDYEKIGFEEMSDINEWMYINGYSISIKNFEDSCVFISQDEYYKTINFDGNSLSVNGSPINENSDIGKPEELLSMDYSVIDNDVISGSAGTFYENSRIRITERRNKHGFPILIVSESIFEPTENHSSWLFPTKFIDWSRSPEFGTYIDESNGKEHPVIKFYLNSICLNPNI